MAKLTQVLTFPNVEALIPVMDERFVDGRVVDEERKTVVAHLSFAILYGNLGKPGPAHPVGLLVLTALRPMGEYPDFLKDKFELSVTNAEFEAAITKTIAKLKGR